MRGSLALSAAITLAPAMTWAGTESGADSIPSFVLPTIEVHAERLPDPLGPFPLTTHRIGRDVMERRPGDLRAVLLPLAGLRISSSGAPDAGSALSIRGSTSEQVLVLVDGRRRNSAQGGGADLASIPLDSIEEVEVFRGGASALWGSSALGGAVHIRTRRPEPGAGRLRLATGTFGMRSAAGGGSLRLGTEWSARASSRFFETEGDYAVQDERRGTSDRVRNGDVERFSGEARIEGPVRSSIQLVVDGDGHRVKRGVPGSEEFPTPSARLSHERTSIGIRARDLSPGRWQRAFDVSYARTDQSYREPEAAFGPVDESHRNTRWRGETSLARVDERVAARITAGTSIDRLDSSTDGNHRRRAGDFRGQVGWDTLGRSLRWMAAARLDLVEGFDPFVSPRIGALCDVLPDHLTLRASWGLSYRTPSFDDLFWPARATAAGNPDLAAERGRDLDVGIGIRGLPLDARVAVDAFVRRVEELIQWIPGASGIWRPHNIGRATISGVEADATLTLPLPKRTEGRLSAQATFLDTEDGTGEPNADGKRLVYRPRWTGAVSFLLTGAPLGELETSWRFVDEVFVTRSNTKMLPGYALGDVRWRCPLSGGLSLDLALLNILDERARDFRDYPLPGRSVRGGITWKGHFR